MMHLNERRKGMRDANSHHSDDRNFKRFVGYVSGQRGKQVKKITNEGEIEMEKNTEDTTVEVQHLKAENEKLNRALWIAAGYLSTTEGWTNKHPQEAYDWLLLRVNEIAKEE